MPFPLPGAPVTPTMTPPTGPSPIGPAAQAGVEAQAQVKITEAVRLLTEALGMMKNNIGTDLAQKTITAIKTLAPVIPEVAPGLGQSEMMAMMSGLQAARPAPPGPPGMGVGRRPTPSVVAGPPMMGGMGGGMMGR